MSEELVHRLRLAEQELERLRGELARVERVAHDGQSNYICGSVAAAALRKSATEYPYPIEIEVKT